MQLTKLQRKSLDLYLMFRRQKPTLITLIKISRWKILLVCAYFVVFGMFLYLIDNFFGTGIMLGMILGYLSVTIANLRVFVRLWPVISEVLDWAKVEFLLERDQ